MTNFRLSSVVFYVVPLALVWFVVGARSAIILKIREARETAVADGKPCGLFDYPDVGTDRCEHCSGLCDHAEQWDTVDRCRALCSDYLQSRQCREDQYYDVQARTRSSCLELCQHHEARGTIQQCQANCPDYQLREAKASPEDNTTALKDLISTPHTPAGEGPEVYTDESLHWTWIIVGVAGLVCLFLTAVIVLLCLKNRCNCPAEKHLGTSVNVSEAGTEIHMENMPLTHPEAETQPDTPAQLVTNGT